MIPIIKFFPYKDLITLSYINMRLVWCLKHLLFFLIVLAGYHKLTAQPISIVTVDVNKLIKQELVRLSDSKFSEAEKTNKLKLYSQELADALTKFAISKNVVVLTKPAVISGACDVSEIFSK
jgi:hypothetical protein